MRMTKLEPGEYDRTLPLLAGVPFNVFMANGVVTGRIRGTVFADNRERPRSCYIRHPYGMSFLIGYCDTEEYRNDLMELLLHDGKGEGKTEMLQVYPEGWHDFIQPHVDAGLIRRWGRVNFRFVPGLFASLPPCADGDGKIVRTTAAHLEELPGTVIPDFFWNSREAFLSGGIGYSYVDGDVRSIAFSSYLDDRFLEIGIETRPEHRGKGYAQLVCRRLIRHCLAEHLEPVWSCKLENTQSYRLALKVGFQDDLRPHHPYYELPRNRG